MKKQLTFSIIAVLMIVAVVSGGTYAFFTTSYAGDNNISTNSDNMNIIFSGGQVFNGPMNMVSSREEGYKTTINIRTSNDSVHPNVTLYINIDNLSSNLAVNGFKWEVCAKRTGDTTSCRNGNFTGYNDTNNNKINIYPDYPLSSTNTEFDVYLWLDGSLVNDSVAGGTFRGYIGATSEEFTAKFT